VIERLADGIQELIVLAALFTALSLLARGMTSLRASWRDSLAEWRLNLVYYFSDMILLVPVLTSMSGGIDSFMAGHGLKGLLADEVASLPTWAILLLAVAVSDLIAYWVHRLMHISWLWPVHAAHHSDRAANWLTLIRFHPLNRFIAVGLSALVFVPLGFPVWSVVASNWVRHFYGYFIHANVDWRFGLLRYLFVSPHLHRWHHSSDAVAFDRNFASVFALYDVIFGTFYSPKEEAGDLGVSAPAYPVTWCGQTLHPFMVWRRALLRSRWSAGNRADEHQGRFGSGQREKGLNLASRPHSLP